jgi:DedD protein
LQAPVSPELDADGVPVAWILQVATVSDGDRAESLRRQLLDIDEKAYVKRIRRGDKDLYRVYVGPKFERARLETLKPRIDSEFKVDSLVVRYLP